MKAATLRHWRNDHAMDVILGGLWDPVLSEGVPSRFKAILSGLSDDDAGSGGATSGRLTQPESLDSALAANPVSLSVHRLSDEEPVPSPSLAHPTPAEQRAAVRRAVQRTDFNQVPTKE
jgi:hypothetical protein